MILLNMSNDFIISKGKNKVFISAPHVFSHKRPSMTGVYKYAEPWTDYIARAVADESSSSVIYTVQELNYDPNYHSLDKNEYKAEVAKFIKKEQITHFFDLHGLSDKHQYDFGVFYPLRYSKSKNLAYDFAESINSGVLHDSIIHILNCIDNDQETLCEFVAQTLKVPSLQIEISQSIRHDDHLREGLIGNIAKFINNL